MKKLMTKHFSKWLLKQKISYDELKKNLSELKQGNFEANLGGYLYKKRIRFKNRGKRGSGRIIICYEKENRAIYIYGFAKNEKSNLSKKELTAFKELAKILLNLSEAELEIAIKNKDFIELK